MLYIKNDKIMYFDSDQDFYNFCVIPKITADKSYCDFILSSAYYEAVNNGKIFIIKDPNSQIYKRKAISSPFYTIPISNLEQFNQELYDLNVYDSLFN